MNIYEQVINHYGKTAQKEKAIEELKELTNEINEEMSVNTYDYDYSKMLSEMADVYNMLRQLRIIYKFTSKEIIEERMKKMKRTLDRIKK